MKFLTYLTTGAFLFSGSLLAEDINFSKDVRPILAKYCFACHGPDDKHREADLRLDTEDGAKQVIDGFAAVVEGKPEESDLYLRMIAEDEDDLMPPPKHGKFMKPEEIEVIKQWIQIGAPWGNHWAYEKPVWPKGLERKPHAIDELIKLQAEKNGLALNQKAEKRSLIRRLSFDLRGLPPSQKEIQTYLKDSSDNAFEKLIDQFLSSTAYGERWALHWLDLARYADSQGYEKDKSRQIWRYRDWVIDAFNEDMPFDQFTIEQLAGDMLDDPTHNQVLATAFHRNTMTNLEGGTDDEEFRILAVKDRVDTTGLVWMGLSVGCAKCHTHKYDPITIDEYYQLYAIFNQTADRDLGNDYPFVPSPTKEQLAILEPLREKEKVQKQIFEGTKIEFIESMFFKDYFYPEYRRLKGKDVKDNKDISKLLKKDQRKLTKAEVMRLKHYFAAQHDSVKPEYDKLLEIRKKIKEIGVVNIPIMKELTADKARETRLHERGNFLNQGKVVKANFPSAFHTFDAETEKTRLDLAKWLMSKDNPLTSRVHVNRIWASLFGNGLVESLGDFGSQGTFPSHPRLLDWLALEFIENGWSMKKLLKTIMMSDAYQRSSYATKEQLEKDPKNTFLARGPRTRLEAESIRDQALSISGLLSQKMYGPPVMPPQPEGIWASVYSSSKWVTSQGEDRHRRGLYTYIKRTAPYPSMMIFDGTSRENCNVQRLTTNTPLQAFVTLNDPVYVEAVLEIGRQYSERVSKTQKNDLLNELFEKATSRLPSVKETETLLNLYEKSKAHFISNPEKLATYIGSYELNKTSSGSKLEWGAWSIVASAILNLDECFMKG